MCAGDMLKPPCGVVGSIMRSRARVLFLFLSPSNSPCRAAFLCPSVCEVRHRSQHTETRTQAPTIHRHIDTYTHTRLRRGNNTLCACFFSHRSAWAYHRDERLPEGGGLVRCRRGVSFVRCRRGVSLGAGIGRREPALSSVPVVSWCFDVQRWARPQSQLNYVHAAVMHAGMQCKII
jgi:hypothetical protein